MLVIDGSHIPISAHEINHTDYFNRKGLYLIVVQAVVDDDYRKTRKFCGDFNRALRAV